MWKLLRGFSLFGLICFCSLSFAGGASYYQAPGSKFNSSHYSGPNVQSLAPFNTLIVSNNIDLKLVNSPQYTLEIFNSSEKMPVVVKVKNNTVYISSANPFSPTRPQVQLNVPYLNQLSTHDSATVQGNFTNKAWLNINSSGTSKINLTGGLINLQQINAKDSSQIKLYWVDSSNLIVNGNSNSRIRLAGTTPIMHASLSNSAQLQAQYLRAGQAIIQTDNHAFVGIAATTALRGFASNDSNIFYYKYPQSFTELDMQSGNVLQVDWRP